jgi:High potential iron-sulfur protein
MTEPTGKTRRIVLRAGLGMAAAGVAGMAMTQPAQAQKIAKEVVLYQDSPKNGQECDKCTNWQPPNACTIVDGTISPHGWCGAFAPKT